MKITVTCPSGSLVWERDTCGLTPSGIASRGYVADGVQAKIIDALGVALQQAEFEASAFAVSDIVTDVGAPAA